MSSTSMPSAPPMREADMVVVKVNFTYPVVDTGAEFESPSGAPLGYDRGSPVGDVIPGPAEP